MRGRLPASAGTPFRGTPSRSRPYALFSFEIGAARLVAERLGARLLVVDLPKRLACCVGLLRPRVLVSLALVECLGPGALEAVLAHEASHARRRDPLRQVLGHATARALWFAPLAAALAARQRLRIELAADRVARARRGVGRSPRPC